MMTMMTNTFQTYLPLAVCTVIWTKSGGGQYSKWTQRNVVSQRNKGNATENVNAMVLTAAATARCK